MHTYHYSRLDGTPCPPLWYDTRHHFEGMPFSIITIIMRTQSQGMSSNSTSRYLGADCHSPSPVYLGQHPPPLPPLSFVVRSERTPKLCHNYSADLRCCDIHGCDNKRIGRAYTCPRRACTHKAYRALNKITTGHAFVEVMTTT